MANSHDEPGCKGRGEEPTTNWAGVRGSDPGINADALLNFAQNGIADMLHELSEKTKPHMNGKFMEYGAAYCERRIHAALFDADRVNMKDYGRGTKQLRSMLESTLEMEQLLPTVRKIDTTLNNLLQGIKCPSATASIA